MRKRLHIRYLAHCLGAGLALCMMTAQVQGAPKVDDNSTAQREDGRLLASRQCSACHAIGKMGTSPRPNAPVFRHILSRYHENVLEKELVEGIRVGHPDMPTLRLNPAAVSALVVYLRSIQKPEHASSPNTHEPMR